MTEGFDLHEFPPGYTGRRRYVHVKALGKMIPVIYTFQGMDGRNHILPEYGGTETGVPDRGIMVMRDIGEYTSVVDGSHISSRSAHREHMRQHGLIEVGNERMPARRDDVPQGIGRDIKRAMEQLRGR